MSMATDPGWHRGDWMQTWTGKQFYPLDPDPDQIDPIDIAHALSNLCRYAGHVDRFYSVAEHCVLMSDWLLDQGHPEAATLALLHDATEAYVVDVPRPLKVSLPDYRAAERLVERAIETRFDIAHLQRFASIVKIIDTRILLDERSALLSNTRHQWGVDSMSPLGVIVESWAPSRAEHEYLVRLDGFGLLS